MELTQGMKVLTPSGLVGQLHSQINQNWLVIFENGGGCLHKIDELKEPPLTQTELAHIELETAVNGNGLTLEDIQHITIYKACSTKKGSAKLVAGKTAVMVSDLAGKTLLVEIKKRGYRLSLGVCTRFTMYSIHGGRYE